MLIYKATYEAFGDQGPYLRPARTVGELPYKLVKFALRQVARNIDAEHIYFGLPVYQSIGMTKAEAIADGRPELLFKAGDLPLEYVNISGKNKTHA